MRRSMVAFAVLAAVIAALAAPSWAVPGGVVTTPGFSFAPGDDDTGAQTLRIAAGTDLEYVNLDRNAPHSVAARGCVYSGAGACHFRSPFLSFNQRVTVVTSALPPGSYRFVCEVHPSTMQGTLVIV